MLDSQSIGWLAVPLPETLSKAIKSYQKLSKAIISGGWFWSWAGKLIS
jgi:hypothetical protein